MEERWRVEHDDQRRPVRAVGTCQDITARMQAEVARRASETQLSARIGSVDGIVWEADATTLHFTFVSAQAERLLGYPTARWIEEPTFWADHIHPEDRERAVNYCVACTLEHRDHEFDGQREGGVGGGGGQEQDLRRRES